MSNASVPNEISIDNVKYVRTDSLATPPKSGKRAVIVMDRGWIMAGDVEYYKDEFGDKRIRLTRVIHIRKWDSVGYDGMVRDPNSPKVKPYLFPVADCHFPASTELFSTPVPDNWGF